MIIFSLFIVPDFTVNVTSPSSDTIFLTVQVSIVVCYFKTS